MDKRFEGLTEEEREALSSPMWPSYQWKKFVRWLKTIWASVTNRPEQIPLYTR